jgi:glucokinase
MKQKAIMGIDLGGTKISGAVFDPEGHILMKDRIFIDGGKGVDVANLMVQLIQKLKLKTEEQLFRIAGIGVAVPGIYYRKRGTVWAPNIEGWESYPLLQHLRKAIDSEVVVIDNDRACYILGETWKGAAQGCKDAIFLAVGTGIGAGILVNGSILRGQSDIAGAIGWMALTDHYISPYRDHGCFEHHASGNGMALVANEQTQLKLSTREIFDHYSKGDPLATAVIEKAIFYWGKAAANLVSIFNPEKIIFGGGVFGPAQELLADIYREAARWAQPLSIKEVQFLRSSLGSEAGLYGTARLVKDRLKQS